MLFRCSASHSVHYPFNVYCPLALHVSLFTNDGSRAESAEQIFHIDVGLRVITPTRSGSVQEHRLSCSKAGGREPLHQFNMNRERSWSRMAFGKDVTEEFLLLLIPEQQARLLCLCSILRMSEGPQLR